MATNAQRKAKTRQRILTVATQLYFRQGVKDTSIKAIAEAAGVSQVTLYKYFESKAVLSHAVVVQLIEEGYREDLAIVRDVNLTFREKMARLMHQSASMSGAMHTDFYQYIVTEMSGESGSDEAMVAYNAQKNQFWRLLLEQGRSAGEIDVSISDEAVLTYLDMFIQYFLHQYPNDDSAAEERLKTIMPELDRLFFFGLMGRSTAESDR